MSMLTGPGIFNEVLFWVIAALWVWLILSMIVGLVAGIYLRKSVKLYRAGNLMDSAKNYRKGKKWEHAAFKMWRPW
jgi:hypothetical protein